jgi:hypothetical protein
MKKIYLFLLLTAFSVHGFAQQVWDNFEDTRKGTYGFISGSFIPYNENPDQTGGNTSLTAAQYTRNAAETFDVIILDAPMANLSDYIDGTKQMSIDVWSPGAGIPIQITLENSATALPDNFPTGRHSVYLTETTVAGAWETLTFAFDVQPDPSVSNDNVNRIVLLFNPGTNTSDTYYWDNLNGPEFAQDPCEGVSTDASILNDFECNQNVRYTFSHAGINHRRILNPDPAGVNQSSYVAQYGRNGGEEFDVIIGKFDGNLPVTETTEVKLDVWDPNAPTEVIVSLQANNGDVILEMSATTSVSSEWQTLVYDASPVAASNDIAQFVILFNPGNFSSLTYYYDNFKAESSTNVRDISEELGLNVFPNPTTGTTTFDYTLQETADVLFTVRDITGKTISESVYNAQAAGSQQIRVDASNYPSGFYLYTFQIDGNTATGKFVVSK